MKAVIILVIVLYSTQFQMVSNTPNRHIIDKNQLLTLLVLLVKKVMMAISLTLHMQP